MQSRPLSYGHLNCPLSASLADHFALLGIMLSLLNDVAGHHVYGKLSTTGRPRGHMTLNIICSMKHDNLLSKQQQHRWLQFLHIRKAAHWECLELVLLAEELRPMQYGHFQDQAQVCTLGQSRCLFALTYMVTVKATDASSSRLT